MDEVQIVKELTTHGNQLRQHDIEIRDIKKRQDSVDEMVKAVATLNVKQEQIEGDVKEIKSDVKSLKDEPGNMWRGVVEKVIFAAIGVLVGWLLKQVGVF